VAAVTLDDLLADGQAMPVPANSSLLCSRWNMPKILSKYWGSMPRPLSSTVKRHLFVERSW